MSDLSNTYPDFILPYPLIGLSADSTSSTIISQMETGRRRARNRFSCYTKAYKASWTFTLEAFENFKQWHASSLDFGATPFTIQIDSISPDPVQLRFEGPYSENPVSDQYVNVSATLMQDNVVPQDGTWIWLWGWYGNTDPYTHLPDFSEWSYLVPDFHEIVHNVLPTNLN